jgi:tRNA threonylcarbamoyl adenosine modification protein (Sua5/YciO/YrdC/YwlC family)
MIGTRSARLGGPDPEPRLDEAVAALRDGGLLVHPTESVYGIGGVPRALDDEIARLKGRAADRPLLRLAGSRDTLRRSHPRLQWSRDAEALADAFWPGPLTLVLDDGSGSGLGVRVEGHPLTRRVLRDLGDTMSSTSLNRSGDEPAATEEEVRRALEAMPSAEVPVFRLTAGTLAGPPPSTVLSLRGGRPRLLREGAVPWERIADRLGREPARD